MWLASAEPVPVGQRGTTGVNRALGEGAAQDLSSSGASPPR